MCIEKTGGKYTKVPAVVVCRVGCRVFFKGNFLAGKNEKRTFLSEEEVRGGGEEEQGAPLWVAPGRDLSWDWVGVGRLTANLAST